MNDANLNNAKDTFSLYLGKRELAEKYLRTDSYDTEPPDLNKLSCGMVSLNALTIVVQGNV